MAAETIAGLGLACSVLWFAASVLPIIWGAAVLDEKKSSATAPAVISGVGVLGSLGIFAAVRVLTDVGRNLRTLMARQ